MPARLAFGGITLNVEPAEIFVTLTTAASSGSTFRDTIACSAVTIAAAAAIGSRPECGHAAWHPSPETSISNLSLAASIGPRIVPVVPAGSSGHP